ncbi:MAG: bifunctional serine/threonine-protein kinase/formylglycine-generating enzyme family protein, partial [Alloprevotella sp.]
MQHLLPNSTLQGGKYRIVKKLGQGGFGITYLAIQTGLERRVVIKEFFMKEFCERDSNTHHVTMGTEGSRDTVKKFQEKFLKEARHIAKFNHPHIVRIIDVFDENNTSYYVTEYASNGSLEDKVKAQGALSESVATRYILQVADALDFIHQKNMNHLDVKPGNIVLNEADDTILIDFGLSKQYDATTGNQTSTTPLGISEGFAPMEQYKKGGVGAFTPETDIYALGATFFFLLTGTTPPSAPDVNEYGVPLEKLREKRVSEKAISIICQAMKGRKMDRMKQVRTLIDGLKGEPDGKKSEQVHDASSHSNDDTKVHSAGGEEKEKRQQEFGNRSMKAKPVITQPAEKANEAYDSNTHDETIVLNEHTSKVKIQEQEEYIDKLIDKPTYLYTIIGIIVILIIVLISVATVFLESLPEIFISLMVMAIGLIGFGLTFSHSKQKIHTLRFSIGNLNFRMIKVESGTFTMGATSEMTVPWDDETPTHQVTLSSYYIGETEVTQALWNAVMGSNPSYFKGDNLPVEQVSWNDCQTFISKLNSLTGKR